MYVHACAWQTVEAVIKDGSSLAFSHFFLYWKSHIFLHCLAIVQAELFPRKKDIVDPFYPL